MHEHLTLASPAGALALIAVLGVVVTGLATWTVRRSWVALAIFTAVVGSVFQLGHAGEHVLQAAYWMGHRGDAPWMTPWASALADSFGRLGPGTAGLGMEAMHLTGNAIFLAGTVALLAVVSRIGPSGSLGPAKTAVVVQAVHVAEHIGLTATVLAGGPARGVSTLFGTLQPGPALWTYRIWWHLMINVAATAALALAVVRVRRRDRRRAASPAFAG